MLNLLHQNVSTLPRYWHLAALSQCSSTIQPYQKLLRGFQTCMLIFTMLFTAIGIYLAGI